MKPRKPRREDEPAEAAVAAKPAAEVSLESADKDQKAAASKRKPGLDDETAGDDDLGDIEDMDIDIEDDDDDTLLEEDEDEDEDMGGIVSGGDSEEP